MFNSGYQHYRGNLANRLENAFYENAYVNLEQFRDRVLIPDFLSFERARKIVRFVYEENPSFFHFLPYNVTLQMENGKRYLNFELLYSRDKYILYENLVKKQLTGYFEKSKIRKTTEVKQLFSVCNLIVTYGRYDSNILKGEVGQPEDFSCIGFFKNRKAVCYGFSQTLKLFCDELGIKCMIVHGKLKTNVNKPHAWNIVELEGRFIHVDVTSVIGNLGLSMDDPIPFIQSTKWISETRSIQDEKLLPDIYDFERYQARGMTDDEYS